METENEAIDCIYNFENYYKYISDDEEKKMFSKKEIGYIWLCHLFATFYDSYMELKWGEKLYKTINAIINRTQLELLDSDFYEDYLICLNLIDIDNLEWGSSIRYCWFENDEIKNNYKGYLKQIDNIKENK